MTNKRHVRERVLLIEVALERRLNRALAREVRGQLGARRDKRARPELAHGARAARVEVAIPEEVGREGPVARGAAVARRLEQPKLDLWGVRARVMVVPS